MRRPRRSVPWTTHRTRPDQAWDDSPSTNGRHLMTMDRGSTATAAGHYADVNGVHMYYETYGTGRPLLLLHGGLGSGETFAPVIPLYAAEHQVIVPDLQGHGRTADIDRPIDVRLMADDIAALIDHLGLEKPDVFGYSIG